jgi:hypothetical protein
MPAALMSCHERLTAVLAQESVGEEEARTYRKYNFKRLVLRRHGMRWNETVVFGGVLREGGAPLAAPATEEAGSPWQHSPEGGRRLRVRGALLVAVPTALAAFVLRIQGTLHWGGWRLWWRGRAARGPYSSPSRGSPHARPALGLSASPQQRPGLGSRPSSLARLDAYAQD